LDPSLGTNGAEKEIISSLDGETRPSNDVETIKGSLDLAVTVVKDHQIGLYDKTAKNMPCALLVEIKETFNINSSAGAINGAATV
jgi:hypothetical protein